MKKCFIALVIVFMLSGCIPQEALPVQETSVVESAAPQNTTTSQEPTQQPEAPAEMIAPAANNRLYKEPENIELLARLEGHSQKLWTIDASAHNSFVSGGEDSQIILWDAETLGPIAVNDSHTRLVEEIFFLKNGDVLSISDDNSLRRLSSADGSSEVIFSGTTKEFTFSPDESIIVISNGSSVTIYQYDSFEEISTIQLPDGSFDIRLSSDTKHLFSVGHNGKVQKWDVNTGELLAEYEGLSYDVHCLEITKDDRYIVAGATDQKVAVWDVESKELISKYSHRDGLYDLDVSNDGKLIASVGVDRQVILADLETGSIIERLHHDDEIHAVAIDPNGQYIVAGGYDSDVYVWGFNSPGSEIITAENAAEVDLIAELDNHIGFVFDADISNDNTMIASAERGVVIKVNIWDTASRSVIQSFEMEQTPITLKFTNDDKYLLCKGEMGDLKIWDIAEQTFVFSSADLDEEVVSVDISSDNKLLVTGGHGSIKLWDFETMQVIRKKQFDDEYIISTIFSPDDSMIAFAYAGGTTDFSAYVLKLAARTVYNLYLGPLCP